MQKCERYLLLPDWLQQIKIGEVAAICLGVLFNHQVPRPASCTLADLRCQKAEFEAGRTLRKLGVKSCNAGMGRNESQNINIKIHPDPFSSWNYTYRGGGKFPGSLRINEKVKGETTKYSFRRQILELESRWVNFFLA